MSYGISHSFKDESLEAKARWFMEKGVEERLLEAFVEMTFINKLKVFDPPDDRSTFKTVRVLEQRRS